MSQSSIFEIPLILDLICSYLSPKDIFLCCKVSKSWSSLFSQYQWRTVKIVTPNPRCEWPSPTQMGLIVKNAYMIWSLDVDNTRVLDELFDPVYTPYTVSPSGSTAVFTCYCTNLRSLTCDMISLAESDTDDFDRSDCSEALVVLVNRNSRLLELHVKKLEFQDMEYNTLFFSALATHPTLSSLQISSPSWIDKTIYGEIIKSIPKTLKSLSIAGCSLQTDDDDEEPGVKHSDQALLTQDLTQPALILQELHLRGYMVGFEESVLFPLLRKCPRLESFTVPEIDDPQVEVLGRILAEYCPGLKDVAVYWNDLPPEALSTLIIEAFPATSPSSLLPCRLRSLTIGGWIGRIEYPNPFDKTDAFDSLPVILNRCGSTLECLRIQEALDIPCADYELILTSCPKLKELSYIKTTHGEPLSPLYGYRSTSLEGLVSAPQWVCKEIEILHMIVIDTTNRRHLENEQDIRPSTNQKSSSQETASVPTMLSQLYQRIGQLQKLKNLTLGWESLTLLPEESNFSMTLEAGLRHMSGLKDLEEFHVWVDPLEESKDKEQNAEITESKSRFLGRQEREWMALNWPKMREFMEIERDVPDENQEY
ncbi:hypothetical protein BGX27_010967 [Mortierella sp. AM989]|nr:hypothetical protein BGX27_010967 [Mortierella sp. AM989]